MNNHPDGRIVMRQGGHRQLGTWWEGVFDRGLFSCESCGIHYHPTIALPERHGSLDETGALVMPESELPRIPTPNEQMEAYEEQGGERKFNSLVWGGGAKAEKRPRATPTSQPKQKKQWSEGRTIGVGLLVAFLLISGLGDCDGGGDCVDSYGQVRIDNC